MSERPFSRRCSFGPFLLDLEVGELRRDGEVVPLRPKAITVLVELVREAGSLVPRERLLEAAWDDTHVEGDAALHGAVREIRAVLGDVASRPRFVETVHRRGYRFIADVESHGGDEVVVAVASAPADGVGTRSRWTAAAVAVGLVAGVVSGLVLNPGPLRRSGPAADSGLHVLTASDDVLQARYLVTRGGSTRLSRGAAMLRDAVAEDGASPLAWSGLAMAELSLGRYPESRLAAERALELHPESADAHRVIGQLELLDGYLASAERHVLRALELDPATGKSQHAYAYVLVAKGRVQDAVVMAETARALAPTAQVVGSNLARFYFYAGEYRAAMREAERVLALDADFGLSSMAALDTLQAAAWARGDMATARDAVARMVSASVAPAELVAELRSAPAEIGHEAGLRWRIAYLERQAWLGPNRRVWTALLSSQIGDADGALHALQSIEEGAWALSGALRDPRLRALGPHPEIDRLAREHGLPAPR